MLTNATASVCDFAQTAGKMAIASQGFPLSRPLVGILYNRLHFNFSSPASLTMQFEAAFHRVSLASSIVLTGVVTPLYWLYGNCRWRGFGFQAIWSGKGYSFQAIWSGIESSNHRKLV